MRSSREPYIFFFSHFKVLLSVGSTCLAFMEVHGRPPGPQSLCISAIWLGRAGFEW